MNIIILGAGLTGLSTAYHLETYRTNLGQKKVNYEIYEKELTPGGLCRSVYKNGFTFDYTGHLIHLTNSYTKNIITSLLGSNLSNHERNAWIYSNAVYTHYPFQANLYGLPPDVIYECLSGFIEAYYKGNIDADPNRMSFLDWVINTFGSGIAKHFMIPYNKKLWMTSLEKMTCGWMRNYIPQPPLKDLIMGAITNHKKLYGYNKTFLYPKNGGIQVLINAFAEKVKKIKLGKRVIKINTDRREVQFMIGEIVNYDILISTIPLKTLVATIDKVPKDVSDAAELLSANSILNINLGLDRPQISEKHWIYFPEPKYTFYRVGFPMNYSPNMTPPGKSSISVEVAYQRKNDLRNKIKEITEHVITELLEIGIISNSSEVILKLPLDIECAYVIYDFKYRQSVKIIKEFLFEKGIYPIGRYGKWEYSYMEDAILSGQEVIESIL